MSEWQPAQPTPKMNPVQNDHASELTPSRLEILTTRNGVGFFVDQPSARWFEKEAMGDLWGKISQLVSRDEPEPSAPPNESFWARGFNL